MSAYLKRLLPFIIRHSLLKAFEGATRRVFPSFADSSVEPGKGTIFRSPYSTSPIDYFEVSASVHLKTIQRIPQAHAECPFFTVAEKASLPPEIRRASHQELKQQFYSIINRLHVQLTQCRACDLGLLLNAHIPAAHGCPSDCFPEWLFPYMKRHVSVSLGSPGF